MSKEVDIVLINLTRLGDLLQSQALIEDLHLAGLRVGLVCLDNFAGATAMLRHTASVWTLPGGRLLSRIHNGDWPQALELIMDLSRDIISQGKPRFVLNLTPGNAPRLLSRLLSAGGAATFGFGIDKLGYGINKGVWSCFFNAAARKRNNAPFNVADMMRGLARPIIGKGKGETLLGNPPEAALEWAGKFLANNAGGIEPSGFAAFQLGASEEKRRWPKENFMELGQKLWSEARLMPVLVGSESEKPLSEIFNNAVPHINAMGQTDIDQLAALLSKCRLLVTNDTGTMHLAAGLGIPSLSFFLATAQPWDTGPLLPGCCCLEPVLECHPCAYSTKCSHNFACRSQISPQAAAELIMGWLKSGNWEEGCSAEVKRQCRVWITKHDGLAGLKPVPGQALDERAIWFLWLRQFWEPLLDELEGANGQSGNIALPGDVPLPARAEMIIESLNAAAGIMDSLKASGFLASKSRKGGELFLRNCERLQNIFDETLALSTLGAFWLELRRSQSGGLEKFLSAISVMGRHIRNFATSLAERLPDGC